MSDQLLPPTEPRTMSTEPLSTALNESIKRQTELSGEAAKHRKRYQALKVETDAKDKELTTLREQVKTLTADRDSLNAKLTQAPNQLREENEKLKGDIRIGKHKTVFDAVAKEMKVRPEALGDLWSLSQYKAETDEPDPNAIRSAIQPLLEGRAYLLDQTTTGPGGQLLPPGPGASRGAPITNGSNTYKINRANLADPAYMMTHQAEMHKAQSEGRLVIEG